MVSACRGWEQRGPRGGCCLPDPGSARTRALSQILTASPLAAILGLALDAHVIGLRAELSAGDEGDGCSGPGAERGSEESITCAQGSSGHRMGFAHSLRPYPLFFGFSQQPKSCGPLFPGNVVAPRSPNCS